MPACIGLPPTGSYPHHIHSVRLHPARRGGTPWAWAHLLQSLPLLTRVPTFVPPPARNVRSRTQGRTHSSLESLAASFSCHWLGRCPLHSPSDPASRGQAHFR